MCRASSSLGTNFETKIFNFRWFLGLSEQNELYHIQLSSKIWDLGDWIFFGGGSLFRRLSLQTQVRATGDVWEELERAVQRWGTTNKQQFMSNDQKSYYVVEEFQHQSRYFLNLMSFRGLLHQLASLLQEGDKRTLLTRLKLKANYFPSHFVPCSDFTSYCWRIRFLLNCLSFMDKMAFYLNYSTKSGEYKRL